jgi:hypothetical protein
MARGEGGKIVRRFVTAAAVFWLGMIGYPLPAMGI